MTAMSRSDVEERLVRSLTGANAVAEAMRQVDPEVVAAYPITPSTIAVETFSRMVADGMVHTEFVPVESEHSAMSACIGAAASGVRAQTVTSSQGLALMWELLYVASGLRLPIVLHVANRTLSAPINIHCDHSDAMGARDAGWVQLFAENPQEVYDHALMAVRIAEDPRVRLPVMECQDGYTVSHNAERVEVLPDSVAHLFVGEYEAPYSLLDTSHPVTVGALTGPDYFFELRRQLAQAMEAARETIPMVFREYGEVSGRFYGAVEGEGLEDAELGLVVMGSSAGTVREVVRALRRQGLRVALVKVRVFRPFPEVEMREALAGLRAVGVLDRALSPGAVGNALYTDVVTTLARGGQAPAVVGYTYGLGGRELRPAHVLEAFKDLARVAEDGPAAQELFYVGLRE